MRRQIEVTAEVFHLIWSSWRQGDTDEDSILKRILTSSGAETLLGRNDRGGPNPASRETEEDNIYDKEELGSVNGPAATMSAEVGKIRWVDDVREAFRALGGEADLAAVYRRVEEMRRAAGRSIVRSLEATIRQTIEAHSSDSDNFKPGNADHFRHVGRGRWALR
jgi:hypothetical protein